MSRRRNRRGYAYDDRYERYEDDFDGYEGEDDYSRRGQRRRRPSFLGRLAAGILWTFAWITGGLILIGLLLLTIVNFALFLRIVVYALLVAAALAVLGVIYLVVWLISAMSLKFSRARMAKTKVEQQQMQVDHEEHQLSVARSQARREQAEYHWRQLQQLYPQELRPPQLAPVVESNLLYQEAVAPPLPAPRRWSALELLEQGELDVVPENPRDGDSIVFGQDRAGNIVRCTWRRVLSILILGLMGGGKTNTVVWLALQLLLKGYKIALIDKHARSDESTHARLKDFATLYDTPIGDNPHAALRVVNHASRVFKDRADRGVPVIYKLIFIVDEFTATMTALQDKTSEWHEVAGKLNTLLPILNSEGRKYGVHVICIGQATNASRTGGTDVRDLFPTRVVHAMRARQAQNLGFVADEKKAIQKLETGEVYLDIQGPADPFPMYVPEVTPAFRRAVKARLTSTSGQLTIWSGEPGDPNAETLRSLPVHTPRKTRQFEPRSELGSGPVQQAQPNPVQDEYSLPEIAQRVLDLKRLQYGKAKIILEIWGAKKGGTEAYKQAEDEYEQILENLVALGYLVINPEWQGTR